MDHRMVTSCDGDDHADQQPLARPQRPGRQPSSPYLNTWGIRSGWRGAVGAIGVTCVLITLLNVDYSFRGPHSSSMQTGVGRPSVGSIQSPPPHVSSEFTSHPLVDTSHQLAVDMDVTDLMTKLEEAETRLRQMESEARSTHFAAAVSAVTTLSSRTQKHDLTTTSNPLTSTEWLGGPWGMPPPLPNELCPRVVWSRGIGERCCDVSPGRGDWTMKLRYEAPPQSFFRRGHVYLLCLVIAVSLSVYHHTDTIGGSQPFCRLFFVCEHITRPHFEFI